MAKMVRAMSVLSASVEMLVAAIGGELGHLRIVGAGHADHLGVRAAGADLHPVVVEQLDGDVALGEQLDVVVELAGGDGAGAGLFDLDGGAGADGLVEIGGGDVEPVAVGLDEKVGQNGNGGFALHHALRGGEFLHQLLAAYGNLHRCPLYGRLLDFRFHDRHRFTLGARSRHSCAGHTLQHIAAWAEGSGSLFCFDCIHLPAAGGWKRGQISGFRGAGCGRLQERRSLIAGRRVDGGGCPKFDSAGFRPKLRDG
jgi:hypothetical protein